MKNNKDKILIILGAHTHLLDFRYEEDFFGLIATPSISPEFGNNPGFATFEVSKNSIQNLEFTFLNLTETLGDEPTLRFMKIRAERDFKLTDISPTGFKNFFDMLKSNPSNYAKWRQVRAGYGFTESKGDLLMKEIGILDPDN